MVIGCAFLLGKAVKRPHHQTSNQSCGYREIQRTIYEPLSDGVSRKLLAQKWRKAGRIVLQSLLKVTKQCFYHNWTRAWSPR